MKRIVLVAAMATSFLLAAVQLAYGLNYFAPGVCTDSSGTRLLSDAIYAQIYIYPKPTLDPANGDHVNSIYARRANTDNVEVGWYWRAYMTSLPQNFIATYSTPNGHWESNVSACGIVSSTFEPYELRRIAGTSKWTFYINGTAVASTAYSTGITSAYAIVGAERNTTKDDGRGSWTYVKYKPYGGTSYAYWPSARTDTNSSGGSYDNDPTYSFYYNKIGASNHWVYVATAQSN
ncbi:MAG: hypothetical protein RBS78_03055 [Coriobacteriia bacterium]|nr:hypothetical protein [Coriobacteriia bacterium]